MICNLLVDGIKATEDKLLFSENSNYDVMNSTTEDSEDEIIKSEHVFQEHFSDEKYELPDDYEIKDNIRDSFEKLKEFIKTKVPLNANEQKLWDLLCRKEHPKNIIKKMGYGNMHHLSQCKYLLINKIKKYKDKFRFTIYDL